MPRYHASPPFGTVENRAHCILLLRFDPEIGLKGLS